MEETAPLNGTTIKDQQAWKEKKGVGSLIIMVAVVLLLGLAAFDAGQRSGSSPVVTRGGGGADASLMSSNGFGDCPGLDFTKDVCLKGHMGYIVCKPGTHPCWSVKNRIGDGDDCYCQDD